MRWQLCILVLVGLLAAPAMAEEPDAAAATQPTTAATATAPAFDRERLDALVALIEGQNSREARRTGAHELLRTGWPQVPPRLAGVLTRGDVAAKIAVAEVLAESPIYLDETYVEPLAQMALSGDAAACQAAVNVLALYPPEQGITRLRALLLDPERPLAARSQAVAALGDVARRAAVELLAEILNLPDHPLRPTALTALEQATGMSFDGDVAQACAWWAQQRDLSTAAWQQRQIQRLLAQDRKRRQRQSETVRRLQQALQMAYQRTPEGERTAELNSYLADPLDAVQTLGLELAQALVTEGRALPDDVNRQIRALLAAPSPAVRAGAVRVVAGQGQAEDAAAFAQMLTTETSPTVRTALIAGLAHLGTADSVPVLLEQLQTDSDEVAAEALTALGRIVERYELGESLRPQVVTAIRTTFEQTTPAQPVLRERAVWAMGRTQVAEFAPLLAAALDAAEPVAVRQAAVRGLAAIDDAAQATALTAATVDPDPVVRRQAVELLARWAARGSSDAILQALWARLGQTQETDEVIRNAAWEGACRILAGRPVTEIERWIGQLPDNGVGRARRTAQLLSFQIERLKEAEAPHELGTTYLRLAREQRKFDAHDAAQQSYLAAAQQLHAAAAPAVQEAAIELVRFALLRQTYDAELAKTLAALNPALDGAAIWAAVRPEIEQRMTAEHADAARQMLVALETPPTPQWPAEDVALFAAEFDETLERRLYGQAVDAALRELQTDPNDAAAAGKIVERGPAHLERLRQALRATINADPPQPAYEAKLHELIRQLAPEWTGFAPDADVESKLQALEALSG